jgi:transcription-repair coupling factor (superfamily II helicase)
LSQLAEQTAGAAGLLETAAATPAVQSLVQRLEQGGAFSCVGASRGAQPFLAALFKHLQPARNIVVVTEGVKSQEGFHQDIETWLNLTSGAEKRRPLYYPAWEILPHEAKLPHADVISERLETLVALANQSHAATGEEQRVAPVVVTSVAALLQRTFTAGDLRARIRTVKVGDRIDPLDLVEWLEDQGYEPEAQVNHKGEIALRGGILDIFPLTSPWPVRVEFFGDDIESVRFFDPITQISNEQISSVTIPPAGELGILKQAVAKAETGAEFKMATLLNHLPPQTTFILCEPELISEQARGYAETLPANDPFFVAWEDLLQALETRSFTRLDLTEQEEVGSSMEEEAGDDSPSPLPEERAGGRGAAVYSASSGTLHSLDFSSLDPFRPIVDRAPDPQVAEAQRREFFEQLHRWLRQGYAVNVFCNNDGERQRFEEI